MMLAAEVELIEAVEQSASDPAVRWIAKRPTGRIRYGLAGRWSPWIKRESTLGRAAGWPHRTAARWYVAWLRRRELAGVSADES